MTEKWDLVRDSFDRAHSDLFGGQNRYQAEFYNISQGTRSNLDDDYSAESRDSIGTVQVEMVPPAMDTTVRTEGTSFNWDTSIRFPENESIVGKLVPLGEDSQKPTEVEIEDDQDSAIETYELHGYSTEKGSGMIMCRLKEQ